MRSSGKLVKTQNGETGRTFDQKGIINGKIPVYLVTLFKEQDDFKYPVEFSEKGILYDPSTLKVIGYLD